MNPDVRPSVIQLLALTDWLRLPALLIESSGTACDSLREIIPVCSYLLMIISKFIYFITHVLFCLPFSATKGWQKQWDVGREGLMVRIMVRNILFSFERIGWVVRWKLMRWWFNYVSLEKKKTSPLLSSLAGWDSTWRWHIERQAQARWTLGQVMQLKRSRDIATDAGDSQQGLDDKWTSISLQPGFSLMHRMESQPENCFFVCAATEALCSGKVFLFDLS